jgi:hypothetical protein
LELWEREARVLMVVWAVHCYIYKGRIRRRHLNFALSVRVVQVGAEEVLIGSVCEEQE